MKYFADFADLTQKADTTLQQLAKLTEKILSLMGHDSISVAAWIVKLARSVTLSFDLTRIGAL